MRLVDELDVLRPLSARQWGLVTAAQAKTVGVHGYQLARAAERGQLVRVHHGVYEFPDSDCWSEFGDWAAQWLALLPAADIADRRAHPGVVLSHAAAARVQQLGVITPAGLELTSPRRINVRDQAVRTYRGPLGERDRDWHLVEGLPVTTPARTVVDLLAAGGDGGRIGSVLASCLEEGLLGGDEAAALCAPAAHVWGHSAGDGVALLDSLLFSAGAPVYR